VEEELLRAVDGGHGAPQVEHRPYIEIRELATNGSRPSLEASAWAPRGGAVAEVAAGFGGGRQREPVRGKALGEAGGVRGHRRGGRCGRGRQEGRFIGGEAGVGGGGLRR
jgi:hypothetical protein